MIYIQLRRNSSVETVDEFPTMREARAMLAEYRLADPTGDYYVSRRPCRAWRTAA